MYTRILSPLDGSKLAEQSLPYVRLVADAFKIPVQLLNIFDSAPPQFADPEHGLYDSQLTASFRDKAIDYLEEAGTHLRNIGITVSCAAHEGNPADRIIDEAEKTPITLIAMATHGRSGVGRWVMGSVTDKVLHGTTNPLLIIHPSEENDESSEVSLENVIVPLDGSPLAEQILPHVVAMVQALGLNVTLVRVTPSADEYYRFMDHSMMAAINSQQYEDFAREADAEATQYLAKVNERLIQDNVTSVENRLLHGDAAKAIIELTDETPNSLAALTTHGRSGVGRWVLGSVADRLVRHSGLPVLVIRAEE